MKIHTDKGEQKDYGEAKDGARTGQDDLGEVRDILQDVYAPESSREDLAEAIGKALEMLEDYESDEDEDLDEEGSEEEYTG